MSEFYLGIISFSVVAAVIAFIWVMIDLKGAIKDVRQILETGEETFRTTVEELNQNLKSMKDLLEDINVVTDNVKEVSSSARIVGDNVRKISEDIKGTVEMVKGIPDTASVKISALRAGIQTGAIVFLKNLIWGVKPERETQE